MVFVELLYDDLVIWSLGVPRGHRPSTLGAKASTRQLCLVLSVGFNVVSVSCCAARSKCAVKVQRLNEAPGISKWVL